MKVYLQDSAYASSSDRRVKRITEDKDFKYILKSATYRV